MSKNWVKAIIVITIILIIVILVAYFVLLRPVNEQISVVLPSESEKASYVESTKVLIASDNSNKDNSLMNQKFALYVDKGINEINSSSDKKISGEKYVKLWNLVNSIVYYKGIELTMAISALDNIKKLTEFYPQIKGNLNKNDLEKVYFYRDKLESNIEQGMKNAFINEYQWRVQEIKKNSSIFIKRKQLQSTHNYFYAIINNAVTDKVHEKFVKEGFGISAPRLDEYWKVVFEVKLKLKDLK